MKETKQRFLKGIDKRVNIESNTDPDRLFTLQNARLQSRGNTSDIERIKGSEVIDKEFTQITVDELRSAIVEGSEASGTFEITNITNEIEPGTPSTGYIGIDNVDPSGACDVVGNLSFTFNVNCVGLDSYSVTANRCDTPEQLAIKIKLAFDNVSGPSAQNAFYTTQINFNTKWFVEYTSIAQGPTEDRVLSVDSEDTLPDSADTLPTLDIVGTSGGTFPSNPSESLNVVIVDNGGTEIANITEPYETDISITDATSQVYSSLLNEPIANDYDIVNNSNVITFTSLATGVEFNATITTTSSYTTINESDITGGVSSSNPDVDVTVDIGTESTVVTYKTDITLEQLALTIANSISNNTSYTANAGSNTAVLNTGDLVEITTNSYTDFTIETVSLAQDFFNEIVALHSYQDQIIVLDRNVDTDTTFTWYYYNPITETFKTIGSFTSTNLYYKTNSSVEYKMVSVRDTILNAPLNKQLNLIDGVWYLNDFVSTYPIIENITTTAGGLLDQNEKYTYSVRYVYYDGHVTVNSSSKLAQTDNSDQTVTFDVELINDLDDTYPDVEVYRKTGAGNFFLIEKVDPDNTSYSTTNNVLSYIDDGKTEIGGLSSESYVWTENHLAQDIVRNRYVKANLEYGGTENNIELDAQKYEITGMLGEYDVIPYNTNVNVYSKLRYENGSESFFKLNDSFSKNDLTDSGIEVKQTLASEEDVKEVTLYAEYNTKQSLDTIDFNSVEIANSNIPTIETNDLPEVDQDKPTSPNVWLGWKYLTRFNNETRVYDSEWDTTEDGGSNNDYFVDTNNSLGTDYYNVPDLVNANIAVNGTEIGSTLPYKIKAKSGTESTKQYVISSTPTTTATVTFDYDGNTVDVSLTGAENTSGTIDKIVTEINDDETIGVTAYKSADSTAIYFYEKVLGQISMNDITFADTSGNFAWSLGGSTQGTLSAIYEIAYLKPLKEAISKGDVTIILNSLNNTSDISSGFDDSDLLNSDISINGLRDTSDTETKILVDNDNIYPTSKNHIYLVADNESVLQDVDNISINNTDVKDDYDGTPSLDITHRFGLSIKGLSELDDGTIESVELTDWTEYDYTYQLIRTDYSSVSINPLFLVGSKNDVVDTSFNPVDTTGWTKKQANDYIYIALNEGNIYEELVQGDVFKTDFPNQIIWSSPIVEGSRFNGTRNFSPENYYNLSSEYGEIVDMRYTANKLLVFCENGVSIVNVGEVLTSQTSGKTFIDSSRFLSGDYWILTNVVDIKPKSIKKYESQLFFGDGVDVWLFQDGLKNISNGRITLNEDNDWFATLDIKNKEYRITDGVDTYAYSIELDEWFQYTHYDKPSTTINNRCFASDGTLFYEHNISNQFNGEDYTTLIESRANDMNEASVIKLFRKLYIEAKNASAAIFKYGLDYSNLEEKNFSDVKNKNGMYHFGVKRNNNNGTKLFWSVESTEENFVMRMLSILFSARNRK